MNKLNLLLLILGAFLVPSNVYAETHLCVAEAGTGVEHGGVNGIHAEIYDVSNKKLIITNNSGHWVLKELGKDNALLNCETEYLCRDKEGFSTMFLKLKSGIFTYFINMGYGEKNSKLIMYTMKGRCSKL